MSRMTVEDLIEELKRLNPELPVLVQDSNGGIYWPDIHHDDEFDPEIYDAGDFDDVEGIEEAALISIEFG